MQAFPRLAEYADEHGIPDEKLQRQILDRFYNLNQRRDSDLVGFMDNLSKHRIYVLTNDAFLFHMLSVEQAIKLRRENNETMDNPNMSEEEQKHLEKRNKFVNENIKRAIQLNKSARDQIKFDAAIGKLLPQKETDSAGQPKETQTPSQVDWDDDSWLEGDDEIYRSGEYDEPDYE